MAMIGPVALIGFTCALIGCATIGHVDDLGDNSHLITVRSNAFSSVENIEQKINEMAEQACGKDQWLVSQRLPSQVQTIRTYGQYDTTARVLITQRRITCQTAPSFSPGPTALQTST